MRARLNESLLYESLRSLVGDGAWSLLTTLAGSVDISRPLPEIVRPVAEAAGVEAWRINDAWQRERHFHEAYPFDYHILMEGDKLFPKNLEGIHFLYCYGRLSLLEASPVTVLGMRGPSMEGRQSAVDVIRELSSLGRPIMGTLDTGLDAYSMLYALNERMGQIVVLASPLHQCMPESQKELMLSLANAKPANLLVSPFPPSAKAQKWFTVPRNEVLVALTNFLVILEERDGGPLWKLARSLTDRGGRVMLTDSCLSNPLYSQARLFAEDHEVLVYRRHGDLKRILTSHSSRRRKTEAEQLELF